MDEDSGEPRVVLGVPFEELQSLTANPLFKVCDVQIRLPKPKPLED